MKRLIYNFLNVCCKQIIIKSSLNIHNKLENTYSPVHTLNTYINTIVKDHTHKHHYHYIIETEIGPVKIKYEG